MSDSNRQGPVKSAYVPHGGYDNNQRNYGHDRRQYVDDWRESQYAPQGPKQDAVAPREETPDHFRKQGAVAPRQETPDQFRYSAPNLQYMPYPPPPGIRNIRTIDQYVSDSDDEDYYHRYQPRRLRSRSRPRRYRDDEDAYHSDDYALQRRAKSRSRSRRRRHRYHTDDEYDSDSAYDSDVSRRSRRHRSRSVEKLSKMDTHDHEGNPRHMPPIDESYTIAKALKGAAMAATVEAIRCRKESGPWKGQKGESSCVEQRSWQH